MAKANRIWILTVDKEWLEQPLRLSSKWRKKKTNLFYPLRDCHYIGTFMLININGSDGVTIRGKAVIHQLIKISIFFTCRLHFQFEYGRLTQVNQETSDANQLLETFLC